MRFSSQLVRSGDLEAAVVAATAAIADELGGPPDVVFPFVRARDPNDYRRLPELIATRFPDATQFGCAARGVIGGAHEEEDEPALSLTGAKLPGTRLVHFEPDDVMKDEAVDPARLAAKLGDVGPDTDALVLLDPFTLPPDAFIPALDLALPGTKIGALAADGPVPRSTMLYGRVAHRRGALVLLMPPEVRLRPVVAQGCRPIGRPHVVTHLDGQAIQSLDHEPALDVMKRCFQELSPRDKEIFRHSLFVAVEMERDAVEVRPDRMLVRNLLGVDPEHGTLGVAALLQQYDVIQFVLRDSESATAELSLLLDATSRAGAEPFGALLFQCLGRGKHLFDAVDHDPAMLQEKLGDVPVGGFFANGEIAPVGGRTFLHGYTSAFALFEHR